jgi:SAP domain-containing new25
MSQRPTLTSDLTVGDFKRHYFLKSELLEFCREYRLSSIGSKPDLNARISAFLETGKATKLLLAPRRSGQKTAEKLSLETVIWPGMTCNPTLGMFFREHIGSGFRFNAAMRNFIHHGAGHRLKEGLEIWRDDQAGRRAGRKDEILPQLAYNRHFREFFAANPGATREQAIAAWWIKRDSPKPA